MSPCSHSELRNSGKVGSFSVKLRLEESIDIFSCAGTLPGHGLTSRDSFCGCGQVGCLLLSRLLWSTVKNTLQCNVHSVPIGLKDLT